MHKFSEEQLIRCEMIKQKISASRLLCLENNMVYQIDSKKDNKGYITIIGMSTFIFILIIGLITFIIK